MIALWLPSANFSPRPVGFGPDLVIVHGTAGRDSRAELTKASTKKSAHYLIDREGVVYQLVQESKQAWHAGVSKWLGREHVNRFSIGVELENLGPDRSMYRKGEEYPQPYTDAQYESLARLAVDIRRRRGIRIENWVGHADISPGRKTDPWEHFDWERFRLRYFELYHPDPEPNIVSRPAPPPEAPPIAA